MSDPAWTKEHDRILRNVQRTIEEYVEKDMVAEVSRAIDGENHKTNAPHFLLKHHPLMCGVLDFHLSLSRWEAGIELTNIWL